ncbi:hypothetical protein [Gracilibacillus xinjiangensis]|uniref:Uncharacterized protein n=1 Tax=Gracilibacillus xinjiangensis TaxID=1193282 RepID=A0ABV8WWM5_9BACI
MKYELGSEFFQDVKRLIGEDVLIVTTADQLNLFGQTFRPIFCGRVTEVEPGQVTLFPVNIKLINAPFFEFPTPLSFPLEKIANMTVNFDCNMGFPLT